MGRLFVLVGAGVKPEYSKPQRRQALNEQGIAGAKRSDAAKEGKFLHGAAVIFTLELNAGSSQLPFCQCFPAFLCTGFQDILRHTFCPTGSGAEIRVMINHFRSLSAVIVVRTVTTIGDADVLCIAFLQFFLVGELF